MNRYFWLLEHPAVLLALVAGTILAFAWPLRDVPAGVVAALMMVVAAGITIRGAFTKMPLQHLKCERKVSLKLARCVNAPDTWGGWSGGGLEIAHFGSV